MDEASEADGADDAITPEPAAARRGVFPSSMGLSLLVPKDAKELRVTVLWGDYQPVFEPGDSEKVAESRPIPKAWQRIDRKEEITLKVSATQKPLEHDVPNSDGLKLVLSVRPVRDIGAFEGLVPKGTRSVSLFLVNRRRPGADELRDVA